MYLKEGSTFSSFGCPCCYCSLWPHDDTVGAPVSGLMPHLTTLGSARPVLCSEPEILPCRAALQSLHSLWRNQLSSCRFPRLSVQTVSAAQPPLRHGGLIWAGSVFYPQGKINSRSFSKSLEIQPITPFQQTYKIKSPATHFSCKMSWELIGRHMKAQGVWTLTPRNLKS